VRFSVRWQLYLSASFFLSFFVNILDWANEKR